MSACDDCLRRAWLVAALAPWLQRVGGPPVVRALLALEDAELLAALAAGAKGAPIRAGHRAFDPADARRRCRAAGLQAVCRCDSGYPVALRDLEAPPAVLHATSLPALGAATAEPAVAVVGARRASTYGLEVARALGRDLGAAGVPVVSGLALGVDGAAHQGALSAGGNTVAVLAGGADVPYPASHARLYRRIARDGTVVSELPPATRAFPWCFPARNRIIAALGALTVVVEAAPRSGALVTAAVARELGREVGAVPGQVTSGLANGTNALIADGAHLVSCAQAALDLVYGVGARRVPDRAVPADLDPALRRLLEAVAAGHDTVAAAGRHAAGAGDAAVALTRLELLGLLRRTPGGRYVRVA
ncbi:MAG: processing protein [Solirubrobacteraceae bacterium]|nr:processing protein [Solirubrobacteraceae bacterium]